MSSKSFVQITSDLSKGMEALRAEIPDTMKGFGTMAKEAMKEGALTALENVMAGHHIRSRANPLSILLQTKHAKEEERLITERAYELLRYVGIERFADTVSKNLSYGDQRRLEIARALATEPQLLALDEPAAGMNATETARLRELVQTIRHDGVTVLLIEHDVKLVMGLCDRLAVLDFGRKIAEDVPAEVQQSEAVIAAYLGGHATAGAKS